LPFLAKFYSTPQFNTMGAEHHGCTLVKPKKIQKIQKIQNNSIQKITP